MTIPRVSKNRRHKRAVKKLKGQSQPTRPEVRVGKTGRIRLKGVALTRLRLDCFERDHWHCKECGHGVRWGGIAADTPTDIRNAVLAYAWDFDRFGWDVGEMAHIKSRGAGGSDTLDNVRTLCQPCHRLEHAGGKPCPRREKTS